MKTLRSLGLLVAAALLGVSLHAQYVAPYVTLQGYLTTSSGLPAQNASLTFQPSQVFFVAGTQVVVTESQCATDVSGQVVGVGNPLTAPRGSAQLVGSLPPGNYYIKFSWYDQFGAQTLASPEIAVQLTATGELQILPPVGTGPPNATGMNVYIGTAPGQETYQGQTTSTTAQYTQAAALTTGANPPIANNTACRLIANDAAVPTGTGYTVSLIDSSGNTLFSYPELWQFFGPGSVYNLSQGIPYYHGQVTYPTPILSTPYNHNQQSISGPLSMGLPGVYYPITGVQALGVDTNTPGWGIDVAGAGLLGMVNANGGYLVNGNGGSTGQCLLSDGTAYDTPGNCVTGLPAFFYQTVLNGSHASDAVTQRGYLAVGSGTGLVAVDVNGVGSQVGRTVLNVNPTGTLATDQKVVIAAAAGTSGHCAQWDSVGGVGDAGGPCNSATSVASSNGYIVIPANPHNIIVQWGSAFPPTPNASYAFNFPTAFPNGCLQAAAWDNGPRVGSGNASPTAGQCTSSTQMTVNSQSSNTGGSGAEPVGFFAVGW